MKELREEQKNNEIEFNNSVLQKAADKANETMTQGFGGPFGAAIVKDGEIISVASNSVLKDNDPTAHAEVNAIREAGKKLGTHDLTGCILYATGSPCPLCMSAAIWANISHVYISGTVDQAAKIGFRDEFMYEYFKGKHENLISVHQCNKDIAQKLYDKYDEEQRTIY